MIKKEHIPHPGTYFKGSPIKGQLTFEAIVRAELRKCGYPCVNCNDCDGVQPDLCDTLEAAGCPGGTFAVNNGLEIVADIAGLGGPLVRATVIDTETFDFSLVKDNVKLDVNDAGGTLGAGETARFIGTNGTVTAETGVYTNGGGTPTTGSRLFNSASNFFAVIALDPTLEQIIINASDTTNAYLSTVALREGSATFGLTGNVVTTLVIEKFNFTGGTDIVRLVGLPTFADNAAAAAALLPVDSVYKTAGGELRIRV